MGDPEVKKADEAPDPAPALDGAVEAKPEVQATPESAEREGPNVAHVTTSAEAIPAAATPAPEGPATEATPETTPPVPVTIDAAPVTVDAAPAAADAAPAAAATEANRAEGPAVEAATAEAAKPSEEPKPASGSPAPTSAQRVITNGTTATAGMSTSIDELWDAAVSQGHQEIWGVTLASPDTHVPTRIVLQKYLNANDGDVARAKDQLVKTLEWRAKTRPLELAARAFSKKKFAKLGYVTKYGGVGGGGDHGDGGKAADPEQEVFTWNVYGAVPSFEETFGNVAEFIEWRVALMELALSSLSLPTATKPITATYDPYKIYQVHDYRSLSFLRSPPAVRSASAETIRVFSQNYPELLKEKFFVNVPAIMGFMYSLMKPFVAPKTMRRFHPMTNGAGLAAEFAGAANGTKSKVRGLADMLPAEYGGKAGALEVEGKETALE